LDPPGLLITHTLGPQRRAIGYEDFDCNSKVDIKFTILDQNFWMAKASATKNLKIDIRSNIKNLASKLQGKKYIQTSSSYPSLCRHHLFNIFPQPRRPKSVFMSIGACPRGDDYVDSRFRFRNFMSVERFPYKFSKANIEHGRVSYAVLTCSSIPSKDPGIRQWVHSDDPDCCE
jgi:hypothetical protein